MDEYGLNDLIKTLRNRGSELQDLEAKSAGQGLPKRILRSISAFANQNDGGTIILGLGDAPQFEVLGVNALDQLQSQLASKIQARLSPAPTVIFDAVEIDGRTLLVVRVQGLPYNRKPCYDLRHGMHNGAYKRVGDQTQLLSPYEIYLYQSQQSVPCDDIRSVPAHCYTTEDVTIEVLRDYAKRVRQQSRSDFLQGLPIVELLQARHVLIEHTFSLMGTLAFHPYPQHYFPKLRMTYVAYDSDELSPEQRYRDSKVFEGPIREMLQDAVQYIMLQLPQRIDVAGHTQQRSELVPVIALREALLNAVVHRDYSVMAQGRDIQIRHYPSRIEIESPGGLFGGMRPDTLKTHQSTNRNPHLATLLEDLGIIENRGDGILAMCQAMLAHGLPEPRFIDAIHSFQVHLDKEPQGQSRRMSNPEVFLAERESFRRADVMTALQLSEGEAKYLLKRWLRDMRISQHGRGRGTYYRVIQ